MTMDHLCSLSSMREQTRGRAPTQLTLVEKGTGPIVWFHQPFSPNLRQRYRTVAHKNTDYETIDID